MSLESVLTAPQGGYQSYLFNCSKALNPIVAAAAPLLYLHQHIASTTILDHELKTFSFKLHQLPLSDELISKAEKLVIAFLTEMTVLVIDHEPIDFYQVLETCAKRPTDNLAVLELGYLCLSLGYQGKRNASQRELIIDNLYHLIEQQTGEHSQALTQTSKKPKRNYWRLPSVPLVAVLLLFSLGMIFIPYAKKLNYDARPIAKNISQLEQFND